MGFMWRLESCVALRLECNDKDLAGELHLRLEDPLEMDNEIENDTATANTSLAAPRVKDRLNQNSFNKLLWEICLWVAQQLMCQIVYPLLSTT